MGSQRRNLSTQYAIITLKASLFSSTAMMKALGKAWGRCWHFLRIRVICFRPSALIACFLWSPATVISMATRRASAGVRKLSCARVEKKKAQICRLSLLNIVRCTMMIGTLIVAPCGLTRNILVRCYD